MAVDAATFRAALGRLATGVAVVSTRDHAGALGMTASSLTSLSLDPPMILACVGRDAALHGPITTGERFAVSILAAHQQAVAERFAERARQRWDATDDAPVSPAGLPLVLGGLAHLECARAAVYPGGDHAIVTGVVAWAATGEGEPLCYWRSTYAGLAR